MSGAPLTPDQENFWRLIHILWDDVPRRLRVFFKRKYRQRFNIAWGDNQQSGEFFIANFPNANTARTGQHIIDTIRQGDTALYDCTALFTCLLYSGTRILHPRPRTPPGTRTPRIRDSERVDELREMRNELAHSTSVSVPSATFNMKLSSLEDVYAQLHWDPTEMRRLARDPVATAECTRLEQLLDAERLRYSGLDLTVQALDGKVQVLDQHQQSQAGIGSTNINSHFVSCLFCNYHITSSYWITAVQCWCIKVSGMMILLFLVCSLLDTIVRALSHACTHAHAHNI